VNREAVHHLPHTLFARRQNRRRIPGGRINGAFLEAGLVDEVSLLIPPGIDGRHGVPAAFDGPNPGNGKAFPLKLRSVERREKDLIWLRYERQAWGQPGL
jgi:riboflavin biosynthesis pyrimidine reductase